MESWLLIEILSLLSRKILRIKMSQPTKSITHISLAIFCQFITITAAILVPLCKPPIISALSLLPTFLMNNSSFLNRMIKRDVTASKVLSCQNYQITVFNSQIKIDTRISVSFEPNNQTRLKLAGTKRSVYLLSTRLLNLLAIYSQLCSNYQMLRPLTSNCEADLETFFKPKSFKKHDKLAFTRVTCSFGTEHIC